MFFVFFGSKNFDIKIFKKLIIRYDNSTNYSYFKIRQSIHISRFNFNKKNKEVLDYCLDSVNWVELLDIILFGIETCLIIFYKCLQELFALTIPKFKTNKSFPSYFSTLVWN